MRFFSVKICTMVFFGEIHECGNYGFPDESMKKLVFSLTSPVGDDLLEILGKILFQIITRHCPSLASDILRVEFVAPDWL